MVKEDYLVLAEIQEEGIDDLLSNYQSEIDIGDFEKARSSFQHVNQAIENANALEAVDKLYYKIALLQETPGKILEIIAQGTIFFENSGYRYDQYRNYHLLRIDKDILSKAEPRNINSIVTVANETIELFEEIFKRYSEFNTTTIIPGEQQTIHPKLLKVVSRGEEVLKHIIPILSILTKEKKLAEKIKEVEAAAIRAKKSDESAKRTKKAVEELGKEQLSNFESEYFEKTANKHEEKCKLFLQWAVGLGGGTIVWGVVSQLIFAKQYGWCGYYKSVNLALCWLSNIYVRDLLIGGILVAGIVACLRAYFANAHGESINRHRYNSLQIYSKGRKLIDDKDRDVFLQKATEAIFEHVPTGFTKYHKEDNKSSDNSAQLALIAAALAANKVVTKDGG